MGHSCLCLSYVFDLVFWTWLKTIWAEPGLGFQELSDNLIYKRDIIIH